MKKNILLRASVFSLSGYGAHARDIATSLINDDRFNVSIIPTGWGGTSTIDCINEGLIQKLIFGVNNKISANTPFIFIHVGLPTEFERKGVYNIGITAGLESTRISKKWVDGCNNMDLIIVPTKFVQDSFLLEGVSKPILVVHEGVDDKIFNVNRQELTKLAIDNITTPINFLSIGQCSNFQYGKDRKQFTLLIDTFMKAFEGDASAGLIIKTQLNNISTPDRYVTMKNMEQLIKGHTSPKIYLIHGELTEEELAELYRDPKVTAYVSMTSGEGWNRPASEAMACGVPIIITGWSGHMDYLNADNASLISYKFQDIPDEVIRMGDWFERGMKWAYPDVDDAIRKMRYTKENALLLKNKAMQYSGQFLEQYSKAKTYKVFTDAVGAIDVSMYAKKDGVEEIVHDKF